MHEMAIAQSVLDIAAATAEEHSAARIRTIKLRIGEMSGVVQDSLEFAFEVLKPGSPAEGASLEIEAVPLRVECPGCGPSESSLNDLNLICGTCGETVRVVEGRELKVEFIDLE